jgi:hypothetical protein
MIRLKAFNLNPFERFQDQAFDIAQLLKFIRGNQRDGGARAASASCSADSMHIIFWHVGEIEINHSR